MIALARYCPFPMMLGIAPFAYIQILIEVSGTYVGEEINTMSRTIRKQFKKTDV